MARPNLISEDMSLPLKAILHVYHFLASLGLAVVLIIVMVITFAMGTFVEAIWNTPVAQHAVYQTWWFNLMGVLLAINIFCAAAIRYPWKKHQTGFVVTHIGLLTLLFGLTLSRWHGIDAQLPVYEGATANWAFSQDHQYIKLTIHRFDESDTEKSDTEKSDTKKIDTEKSDKEKSDKDKSDKDKSGKDKSGNAETGETTDIDKLASHAGGETVTVNFNPGPFNWDDYKSSMPNLFTFAGRHGKGDVLYNRAGIKIEALDFCSDSHVVAAPQVKFKISTPAPDIQSEDGRVIKGKPAWQPVTLNIGKPKASAADAFPFGIPHRERAGGGAVIFSLASGKEEERGFLAGGPRGPTGEQGQIVLHAGGKTVRVNVDDKLDKGRFPLGDKYEAEVAGFWNSAKTVTGPKGRLMFQGDHFQPKPINPMVKVNIYKKGAKDRLSQLTLFGVNCQYNIYDYENKIFGEMWFEHRDLKFAELQKMGVSAWIHILQAADGESLYYRYWNRKKLVFSRKLPLNGSEETAVDAFKMPAGELKLYVDELVASSKPETIAVPRKFDRQPRNRVKQAAAKLRLTVNGKSDEFWMFTYMESPDVEPTSDRNVRSVLGKDKKTMATISMPLEAVDIGFRVRLDKFERKLDPGSSQPAHFSSTVDFLDATDDKQLHRTGLAGGAAGPLPLEIEFLNDVACDASTGRLYVTAGEGATSSIQRIDLANNEVAPLIGFKDLMRPQAIAAGGNRIFWVDMVPSHRGEVTVIRVADASGKPVKLPSNNNSPLLESLNRGFRHQAIAAVNGVVSALAVDPAGERLYWCDNRSKTIGCCNFDGSNTQPDFIESAKGVSGLCVGPHRKRLYFTVPDGRILSADLEAGGGSKLLLSRTGGLKPRRITAGASGDLYWTEFDTRAVKPDKTGKPSQKRHAIMRVKLDDIANPVTVSQQTIDNPAGLVVYKSEETPAASGVYWVQDAVVQRDVWITMNAPVEFSDPASGRWYRLFQEAFDGPRRPGDPEFEHYVPAGSPKDELYRSVLTVNYDPGRGIRSAGCLLVVLGIGLMFYMRAYFFKRTPATTPRRNRAANAGTEKLASADVAS